MIESGQPHEALFLVLPYLHLFQLLVMKKVCRSIRDVINGDVLLWLDIVVEPPLSLRVSDNILVMITSNAHGRLRTLALINCVRITDEALQRVIENNPRINKLYIPGCTSLTADGIVRAVKKLTEHNHDLKRLRLHGVYGITRQHIETLYSCLNISQLQQEQQKQHSTFRDYRCFSPLRHESTTSPIDVEVCPRCKDIRLVFDCPRESCNRTEPLSSECRGCFFCIPRCVECGGCIDLTEMGHTICIDFLCLDCWIPLPKCNMCNKAYCSLHADQQRNPGDVTGFICEACFTLSTGAMARTSSESEHEEDIIED
ncbi:PREDICTED: F-box protein SKIP28 isoform X2 [Nelumbo nucifera]|uniref:F-box domain-containing protein n=2 Tax=Nelumbo nucifera TaxID=4432 RepID=A0A822YI54_NELNU|nr:PREDICTED: F-box protein SKIP28 isoform X2 [Nelumbo nucifera]DAD32152.1 TPA_asm: hypothetical protein HUJ06_011003 [Nelumbo nucifera]